MTSPEILFQPLARFLELPPGTDPETGVRLFALGLARFLPITVLSPVLGGRLVPAPIKIATAALLALAVVPGLGGAGAALPAGNLWWALILKEAFVGLVLGFGSSLLFWAADMSGRLLDNLRGTTTANLMIPQERVQTSLLGDFYFQLFVVLFIAAGGHRVLLGAVFESYALVPPLSLGLDPAAAGSSFVAATGSMLAVTVRLVAPALLVLMAMDVILGVANRMAPQLNVHFLSLSLKSSVGALVAALSLYYLLAAGGDLFRAHLLWLGETVARLHPAAAGS